MAGKYSKWSQAEAEAVKMLFEKGLTDRAMAMEFGVSANSIRCVRKRLGLITPGQLACERRISAQAMMRKAEAARIEPKGVGCVSVQEASIWHLVDLKRAGHSPRFTEFRISSERPAHMITHRPVDRSYCGSQAAMCSGA